MGRLTDFEHDVVGEVCEQIYRSHAAVEQPYSYLHGADVLCDIRHPEAGVSVHVVGVADGDGDNIFAVAVKLGEVERL